MKIVLAAAAAALLVAPMGVAQAASKHFPVTIATPAGPTPPFSAAVMKGDTLYISGTTDGKDPATGQLPANGKIGATVVLNNIKRTVEAAGLTMDDVVWLQIFCSDLKYYGDFNEVYRTYFKGPLPARAFIGAGSLLGGAHFEVMGIAVKGAASKE